MSELVLLAIVGAGIGLLLSVGQSLQYRRDLRDLVARNRQHLERISPRTDSEFLEQLRAGRPVLVVDQMSKW